MLVDRHAVRSSVVEHRQVVAARRRDEVDILLRVMPMVMVPVVGLADKGTRDYVGYATGLTCSVIAPRRISGTNEATGLHHGVV